MKKIIVLFSLITISLQAQEEKRRFELGSTLLTVNSLNTSYYFAPDRPSFEFVNGLLFRYNRGGMAYRAHLSYSDHATDYAMPTHIPDASGGHVSNKDFRLGGGLQHDLLKSRDWLYALADLSYRNIYSSGTYYGGITGADDRFWRRGNGIDALAGLGFRIKPFANVCISPELGYFVSATINTKEVTSNSTGSRYADSYRETNLHPQFRLQLTARF
jgi:hypothetical protein